MTKVAQVTRFYSLDEIMKFIENGGEYPLHHVWCYDQIIKSGIHTSGIEYNRNSVLNKLGEKLKFVNLQQEINLINRSKEFDIIYSPMVADVFLLAMLKVLGLYKKPIVAMAFDTTVPYKKNFFKKLLQKFRRYITLNGIDSLIYHFETLYQESSKYAPLDNNVSFCSTWGADLDFFESFIQKQTEPPTLDFIYTTGGTERDYPTLIEAFKDINFNLKITTRRSKDESIVNNIPNVVIDNSIKPGLYSVGLIRKEYYNCLAVAIPLSVNQNIAPYGSTVVMEAIAMGKPVISTRNNMYPFSLEKEKIGFEVDYADVEGWKQCVNYMIDHPDEVKEMGERAKFLCKTKYNYEAFSKEVVEKIKKLAPAQK